MARRRNTEMEMNFDGLTDAVTNLTGTLILLVVLMFGITHEAQPDISQPLPPAKQAGKPIAPLLSKIEVLKAEIRRVDAKIRAVESQVPALEKELQQLRAVTHEGAESPPHDSTPVHTDRVTFNWDAIYPDRKGVCP